MQESSNTAGHRDHGLYYDLLWYLRTYGYGVVKRE
jgi:hypothetical protein